MSAIQPIRPTKPSNEPTNEQVIESMELAWPIDTASMVALATVGGFRCDKRMIQNLMATKRIQRPPRVAQGGFAWAKKHALTLLAVLEASRKFELTHDRWQRHLNPKEQKRRDAQEKQEAALLLFYQHQTAEDLVLSLANQEDQRERGLIVGILLDRLEGLS